MSINLEEIDYQQTPFGELILRRRRFPVLGERDVYEVILNDEFLMSSLFTAGEIALAEIALAGFSGADLDIIVGGLGLGYTAASVLQNKQVRSLTVIEALPEVIDWHQRRLLPVSAQLIDDPRCRLHAANFFELAEAAFEGLTDGASRRRYRAILVDIDHSPTHVLNPNHHAFYSAPGLDRLRECLRTEGVFALWSNDPPDMNFSTVLNSVFENYSTHIVAIDNPLTGIPGSNTIYVGRN